jgi:cell division protease FtsH
VFTKKYCMAELQICFAGRIAETMVFGDLSSGAQSDIRQATSLAKEMITTWGMSELLGPISYGSDSAGKEYFALPFERDYSEATAQQIDQEIKALTNDAYQRAKTLIEANRENLDRIAKALLKYETLDAEEVKTLMAGGSVDKPTVSGLLAAEQAKPQS